MSEERIIEKRIGARVAGARPRVSVVIPAYECADFIRETLDSVLAQSFREYEILLVNDGSPDTARLEAELAGYFDHLIYLKQNNLGTAAARNTAIELARGEYLAFLDSDDVWLPDYLQEQLGGLAGRGCDMIYADALLFGKVPRPNESFMQRCPSRGEVTAASLLGLEINVITSGTLVRRDRVVAAGLFNENPMLLGIEDFDLWFRLLKNGTRIGFHERVLLKYRVRPNSLSGNNIRRARRSLLILNFLRERHRLTPSEDASLAKSLAKVEAGLRFEIGKYHLIREEFAQARRNFRLANEYYRKRKYFLLDALLKWCPRLVLKFFKRSYPYENEFLTTGAAEEKPSLMYQNAG